ncbi:hypothetical protein LMB68_09225 [Limosilactobacillus reuteri]|uniref:hypothetical protein n=1 Tax=Limosilactobacillus reuteri TaxID=1598 RepID=UPI001E411D21|nr:hypothetical protein [Limosilactobacillus reuteri]MCC4414510.1 hypothetical protein [Limosilactobacillus reuteri]
MRTKILVSKDSIYFICLFLFVLIESLQKIYFFAQNEMVAVLSSIISLFVGITLTVICLAGKYSARTFFLLIFIGSLLFIGYINSKMSAYLIGFLFLVSGTNVDIRSILKTIRYAISISIIISLFLYFIGLSDIGIARRGYNGWGFVHPNVAGQVFMLVILLWIAEHYLTLNLFRINTILIIGELFIFLLTGSRTVLITMTALVALLPLFRKIFVKNSDNLVVKISELINPISLMLTFATAKFLYYVPFFQRLDSLMVNRIFLNSFALEKFGIRLFGQNSDLKTEGTVYNSLRNVYWNAGITVDSTYMTSLLTMGLIPTLIWTVAYVLMMKRVAETKNYIFFTIALVLCFESFMETGMLTIYNNFAFFFLTAEIINTSNKKEAELINEQNTKSN